MDKGQGLPITTIVIAALALLVLVILFAITTGRLAIFTGAASECGGVCIIDVNKLGTLKVTNTMNSPGALEWASLPSTRNNNCSDYEQQVKGSFIARGIRNTDQKPIVCDKCCIPTAY